ncbi:MAG TPA: ubiquinol-cytochrome c reductase iron-sulfur subunit [Nitrospirota bacterium]|nr:ubiquinol-cytochrome c reductase iron-sulfur subunit [Nitrospirota bacterium]
MKPNRREFSKKALYGLLAFLGLGFFIPAIKISSPLAVRERQLAFFPLMSEDDIPRAGIKKTELIFSVNGKEWKTRVFIVSSSEGPTIFSAVCSHLGCLVNYQKDKGEFVCPCHGGKYDLSGKNIAGPPPAPLMRLPVMMKGGMLMVGVKV